MVGTTLLVWLVIWFIGVRCTAGQQTIRLAIVVLCSEVKHGLHSHYLHTQNVSGAAPCNAYAVCLCFRHLFCTMHVLHCGNKCAVPAGGHIKIRTSLVSIHGSRLYMPSVLLCVGQLQ